MWGTRYTGHSPQPHHDKGFACVKPRIAIGGQATKMEKVPDPTVSHWSRNISTFNLKYLGVNRNQFTRARLSIDSIYFRLGPR